eukprot:4940570-Alexandrium_andersonii.AAC.1
MQIDDQVREGTLLHVDYLYLSSDFQSVDEDDGMTKVLVAVDRATSAAYASVVARKGVADQYALAAF